MKYIFNNKTFTVPDNEIDKIMEQFSDISIAEACEIYLSDKDLIVVDEIEELDKKAQKNRITATIHGAKGEKKERKPREKKENLLKKQIIQAICIGFNDENWLFDENIDNFVVRNDEKYIDFTINGLDFTINLVQHRKKKEE